MRRSIRTGIWWIRRRITARCSRRLKTLGPQRVCYGSDTPFCPMRYELGLRGVVYQDLSPQERALVLGGNVQRMLGS